MNAYKKAARFAPERLLLFGLLVFLLVVESDLIELGVHGILKALLKRQEKLLEDWRQCVSETRPLYVFDDRSELAAGIGAERHALKERHVVEHEPKRNVDAVRKRDDEKGEPLLRHPEAQLLRAESPGPAGGPNAREKVGRHEGQIPVDQGGNTLKSRPPDHPQYRTYL